MTAREQKVLGQRQPIRISVFAKGDEAIGQSGFGDPFFDLGPQRRKAG